VLRVLDEADRKDFAYAWRTAAALHTEISYTEERYWAMFRSAESAPDEDHFEHFLCAARSYKLRLNTAVQHLSQLERHIDEVIDVAFNRVMPSHQIPSSSTRYQHSALQRDAMTVCC
jgi:hypothetical protein